MDPEAERYNELAGRLPDGVKLLAVTKMVPVEVLRRFYAESACRSFAESRIPELEQKTAALPGDIEWHFIGRLQGNKVRRAVQLARVIHSVDSLALLERIERIAGEEGCKPRVLLEVNVSGEASKAGVSPSELPPLAERAKGCVNLQWVGLMTMAPLGAGEAETLGYFRELARLRGELEGRLGVKLPELSMGMSGDFELAVEAGATMVRIGSAIFKS